MRNNAVAAMQAEIAADGASLRLYPDPNADRLKAAISTCFADHAIRPEQVFVGNGSDEVLAHAFMALLKHERPLWFPDITYSFYPTYCKLYDIAYQPVPLADDFSLCVNISPRQFRQNDFVERVERCLQQNQLPASMLKLEITESMIEVSTQARATVDDIAADLEGLRKTLIDQCARNNIAICGGGTHPFHAWPERRICPSDRFDAVYQRYGYLAKQFTVFGQHIHVGCETADDAVWLTQALGPYVTLVLITKGDLLDGITSDGVMATTETLLIRGKTRTIRRIHSTHYLERKDEQLRNIIL